MNGPLRVIFHFRFKFAARSTLPLNLAGGTASTETTCAVTPPAGSPGPQLLEPSALPPGLGQPPELPGAQIATLRNLRVNTRSPTTPESLPALPRWAEFEAAGLHRPLTSTVCVLLTDEAYREVRSTLQYATDPAYKALGALYAEEIARCNPLPRLEAIRRVPGEKRALYADFLIESMETLRREKQGSIQL